MKYGTDTQVKQNKKMYGRRIQQLDHILKDNTFLVDGGYREFIVSMYKALVSGRRITPKMELAITKVVKNYAKHINPEHQKGKVEYIEKTLVKIDKIRSLLFECKFSPDYSYEWRCFD